MDDGLGFQLVPWKPSMERLRERSPPEALAPFDDPGRSRTRTRKLSI
jgi:hypothetical protein